MGAIELFFDLVYVFTIIQISHRLLDHLTWVGAVETLLLFLAVWWAWNYSAWAMNWLEPDSAQVRVLLAGLMLAALGMAVAIPEAFEERALLFAASYVALQTVRSLFMVLAFRGRDPVMQRNYFQLLVWTLLAGVLWIVGAFFTGRAQLWWWIAAVAVDYVAPRVGFVLPGRGATPMSDWSLVPEHLAERNRLVFLIALGETILIMGFTLTGRELAAGAVWATVLGFALLFLLWWNYFAQPVGPRNDRDATEMGRAAFAYAHAVMVAGAILVAVAIELVMQHPHDPLDTATTLAVCGGPLLYLIGNLEYLRAKTGRVPMTRVAAGVLLILVAAIVLAFPSLVTRLVLLTVPVVVLSMLAAISRPMRAVASV